MVENENNRFECIWIVCLFSHFEYTRYSIKSNSYFFDYQKNSYFILGYDVGVQEGNIRKTMAARGLVNGRGPRSGRDLVFRCYPSELLSFPSTKPRFFMDRSITWTVWYKEPSPEYTNSGDYRSSTAGGSVWPSSCLTVAVLCHDLASDRGQKHCKSALGPIILVGTAGGKARKVLLVPQF